VITKTVYGSTAEFLRQIQDKTQRKWKRRSFFWKYATGVGYVPVSWSLRWEYSVIVFKQKWQLTFRFVLYKYVKFSTKKKSWEELVTSV
jgi:hypothetical protein